MVRNNRDQNGGYTNYLQNQNMESSYQNTFNITGGHPGMEPADDLAGSARE